MIELYVIYCGPTDFPGEHVGRRFGPRGEPDLEPFAVGTLEEVRAALPSGLVNIGRQELDEPQIREVWL